MTFFEFTSKSSGERTGSENVNYQLCYQFAGQFCVFGGCQKVIIQIIDFLHRIWGNHVEHQALVNRTGHIMKFENQIRSRFHSLVIYIFFFPRLKKICLKFKQTNQKIFEKNETISSIYLITRSSVPICRLTSNWQAVYIFLLHF